jgi:hypothetical protein
MADTPHVHVEFYVEPTENLAKSREAGRPIFEETEFVKLRFVGDPKSTFIAPANDAAGRDRETGQSFTWAEKFPEHYRYFKASLDQAAADGTPLSEVPWLTAAKRAELKALNINTVEGLAGLDGTLLQRIGMGARELKSKAEAWLDKAAGSAVEGRLAEENAVMKGQIEEMQRQMAELLGKATPFVPPIAEAKVEEPFVEPPLGSSPFEAWQDEDIKNWIKDNAGARPLGNPSHATLVARADEINAELAQKAA